MRTKVSSWTLAALLAAVCAVHAQEPRDLAKAQYYCMPAHEDFAVAVQTRWLAMVHTRPQQMSAANDDDLSPRCLFSAK
jgi:hypothetical protein